jgi:hypothetical protein
LISARLATKAKTDLYAHPQSRFAGGMQTMSQTGDGAGTAIASDMNAQTAAIAPKNLLNCIIGILVKGEV